MTGMQKLCVVRELECSCGSYSDYCCKMIWNRCLSCCYFLWYLQPCRVTTLEMCGPTTCNPGDLEKSVNDYSVQYNVIGRWCLSLCGRRHFTPFSTNSNCNVSFSWSLCLAVKCRCLTDNNYAWIEWHTRFVSSATYRIIVCSVVWMGWSASRLQKPK